MSEPPTASETPESRLPLFDELDWDKFVGLYHAESEWQRHMELSAWVRRAMMVELNTKRTIRWYNRLIAFFNSVPQNVPLPAAQTQRYANVLNSILDEKAGDFHIWSWVKHEEKKELLIQTFLRSIGIVR